LWAISGADLGGRGVIIKSRGEIKLAGREESGNVLQTTLYY
jgi:hypothetical protein